mmetsp:Transcript_40770/g.110283  ORF Transcript_40770/g.110283 Transcript_40770/m.110283 type:complete len:206 (-) Transcript_40770:93-710(-)
MVAPRGPALCRRALAVWLGCLGVGLARRAPRALPPALPPSWIAPETAPDLLVRATLDVQRRTRAEEQAAAARAPGPSPVTQEVCDKAAAQLGAMSCSLVTEAMEPEGCECRMAAAVCPAVPGGFGFTGLSPSESFSTPDMMGTTVILCMYWQWLAKPEADMEPGGEARVRRLTQQYVELGRARARASVGPVPDAAASPAPAAVGR